MSHVFSVENMCLYKHITALNQYSCVVGFFFSPGPAAVKDLYLLSNSTSELSLGWNVSEGWVDHYDLYLYSSDGNLQEHKKVGAKERGCIFHHLLPGTLYKLVVISKSRGLSSEASLWARTGERL